MDPNPRRPRGYGTPPPATPPPATPPPATPPPGQPPQPMPPHPTTIRTIPADEHPDPRIDLFRLAGINDVGHCDFQRAWQPREPEQRYRAPLGLDQRGHPLWLDLGNSNGVAIFGSPGSGKATLLRTILFGLAATHAPSAVNFACLGRTDSRDVWWTIPRLPHTALTASARASDLSWDRIDDGLLGELDRRIDLFERAEVQNFVDYQRLSVDADSEPLPRFVVAIDDLPNLLHEHPEFAATLDHLNRSQRLGITVIHTAAFTEQVQGLAEHGQTRLVLNTTNAESFALIGHSGARELPVGEHAYLASSGHDAVRFRAASSDLPYIGPNGARGPLKNQLFTTNIPARTPPTREIVLPPPG